jgi:2-(1,2-epoxy-1,2-dihydrophenyl)acetyl-CoA isomerase
MTAIAFQHLRFEADGAVAVITLNRAERLNAFSLEMLSELPAALGEADKEPGFRAVVVTGAGRGFCAGADLADERQDHASDAPFVGWYAGPAGGYGRFPIAIRHLSKPVIAAVNGPAAGSGMSLALACDFRILSDRAQLLSVFARRGIMPDGAMTYLLPRLVRPDIALKILASTEAIGADEALRLGLATEVVPHDELLPRALAFGRELAALPYSFALSRKALYRNAEGDMATATDLEEQFAQMCMRSEDYREGVAAFLEKREARFVGR